LNPRKKNLIFFKNTFKTQKQTGPLEAVWERGANKFKKNLFFAKI
jgi:hypothetical protein